MIPCRSQSLPSALVFGGMTSVLHITWYLLIPKRLPVFRQDLQLRRWLAACAWLHNTRSTVGYLRPLAPADITEQLMSYDTQSRQSVSRTDHVYKNLNKALRNN